MNIAGMGYCDVIQALIPVGIMARYRWALIGSSFGCVVALCAERVM